jgi:transcriptional regulator GlxA family with amidase domain
MSRSAFAVHFKDLVGATPLEYLTGWRMQKATSLLQKGDKKLFEVAKFLVTQVESSGLFGKPFPDRVRCGLLVKHDTRSLSFSCPIRIP